jgi:hypothetical protein
VQWLVTHDIHPETGAENSAPQAIKYFNAVGKVTRQNINKRVKKLRQEQAVREAAHSALQSTGFSRVAGFGLDRDKGFRLSSKQVQKGRAKSKKDRAALREAQQLEKQEQLREKAFIEATKALDADRQKEATEQKGAPQIVAEINAKYKTQGLRVADYIREKTVRREVNKGNIGKPLQQRGRHGTVPDAIYAAAAYQVRKTPSWPRSWANFNPL